MEFSRLKTSFPNYGPVHCPFQALKLKKASCIAVAIAGAEVFEDSFIFSYCFLPSDTKIRGGYHFGVALDTGPIVHMISKVLYEDVCDIELHQGLGEGNLERSLSALTHNNEVVIEYEGRTMHTRRHDAQDLFMAHRSSGELELAELAPLIGSTPPFPTDVV